MARRFDWRYFVMLAATTAGVVVPVSLWQADQRARAVEARVVSLTPLYPSVSGTEVDLKLSLGTTELRQPVLSVIEIRNSGTRPISGSDFEGPIEVLVEPGPTVRRASLTSKAPTSLRPELTQTAYGFQVQPLLLNPGDQMTVAVLTDGGKPSFKALARIVGVMDVEVVVAQKEPDPRRLAWLQAFFGFFVLTAYAVLMAIGGVGSSYPLGKAYLIALAMLTCGGGVMLFQPISNLYQLSVLTGGVLVVGVGFAAAIAAFIPLRWRRAAPSPGAPFK
jgi:hypothetical protein